MRIAIVSDIHGNLTAFNAVLEDLRSVAPDLVLHGGDLGHGGPRPAEVVERIRELAWRGVMGNVDEMTVRPKSFEDFIRPAPQLDKMWNAIREVAVWTRAQHSTEQIEWLGSLPIMQVEDDVALVHASPTTTWCSPDPEASNAEFEVAYGSIPRALVVYGHVHRPFVRRVGTKTIMNSGSVGLPYDGDCRASYLLITDGKPEIRRVMYEVEQEVRLCRESGMPHPEWVQSMLQSAKPEMI